MNKNRAIKLTSLQCHKTSMCKKHKIYINQPRQKLKCATPNNT